MPGAYSTPNEKMKVMERKVYTVIAAALVNVLLILESLLIPGIGWDDTIFPEDDYGDRGCRDDQNRIEVKVSIECWFGTVKY